MNAHIILLFYVVSLCGYLCIESILVFLNISSAKNKNELLEKKIHAIKNNYTSSKSAEYTKEKSHLQLLQMYISSGLVLALIFSDSFGKYDTFLRSYIDSYYVRGCVYLFGITTLFSIVHMPLDWYSTFVVEEKYGFNTTTLKLWITDKLKGTILSILFGSPVICGVLYFIEAHPHTWWIYSFVFIFAFQILLMLIFPVLIAPLFNTFENLKDSELEQKINRLADALSFESKGIFQIDGSKRSAHANAYFAGFGRGRRIVLYDTLISKLTHDEICAVLAHEIGHAKKHHILYSVLVSGVILCVGLYIASILLNNTEFFTAFGIHTPSAYALLLLISVASEPMLFFISPLLSSFSRKNEYEADAYAVSAVKTADTLESALIRLSVDSLSNLSPHPLYSFFHYSHPTLSERIRAMRST